MARRNILPCRTRGAIVAVAAIFIASWTASLARADSFMLAPENPAEVASARASEMSAAERAAFLERFLARREARAASAVSAPSHEMDAATASGVLGVSPSDPTDYDAAQTELPNTLTIGRNVKNQHAELAGNSTLAEPAAINNRNHLLYAGNFSHVEVSFNHGASYHALSIPAGPADAPVLCCDNDMAVDENTKTGFHGYLYTNSAQTNGVVRIFVKDLANIGFTTCTYRIDPAGAADNIVPDYPHLAVSNQHLYLTINADNGTTTFARIYRFNIAQMKACQTTATQTFDQPAGAIGQRVWVPAAGGDGRARMMWVQNESTTSMRVFNWNAADAAPTSVVRNVAASVFTNPDCRGGTGNFDFIERTTAFGIAGFRTRCAMASGVDQATPVLICYNFSAPQTNRPHAYLRGTTFRISDRVLIAQPDIFSNNACWGYPSMSANTRGNIGMSLAFGGRNGGGGNAVRGVVRLSTPSGPSSIFVSTGVANRSDGRYGDYATTQRYQGCSAWFGATAYSWDSSPVNAADDVDARWIEFGREGDLACYNAAQ